MFCQNCGHQLGDNDKFCTECGTPVRAEENTAGTDPFVAANEPEKPAQEAADPGRVEPVQYGSVDSDLGWNTASSAQSARSAQFSENEPHYKKNTGIIVGIVAGVGALVIIILIVCVTLAGSQAKEHIQKNAPIFNESEDGESDDGFDFDIDDYDDFDFDINETEDYDDFGDYF